MNYSGDPAFQSPPPPPYVPVAANSMSPSAFTPVYEQQQPGAYSNPGQVQQNAYPPEKQQFQQFPPAQFQQSPLLGNGQQYGFPPEKQAPMAQLSQPAPPEYIPPEKLAMMSHMAQMNPDQFVPTYVPPEKPMEVKDDKKSGKAKRFFADTLVGRVARAGVATATTTMKMPAALSPWGDNNPVTLPNVRYRDAVLFTTFAFVGLPLVENCDSLVGDLFGADSFVAEIVSSGAGAIAASTVLKYGVFQIVEQALDKGILEHILPEEEKMIRTTSAKTMQVAIKHKLMGVDGDVRLVGVYPAVNKAACEKGWFCPYLFASGRTPVIPRSQDFAIAQCFGPFLGGDYALAHKFLAESPAVLALCDAIPTKNIGCNRMVVMFTGISPYRANMWSTSRRPGAGLMMFHILDGCPAFVIPVNNKAPICAWSPWTLLQMRSSGAYNPEIQHEQICEYLDSLIELNQVYEHVRPKYIDVMARSVSMVINGAVNTKFAPASVLSKIDPERAGIVMFRY